MKLPTFQPVDPRVLVDNVVFEQRELDDVGDLLHVFKAPRLRWKRLGPDGLLGDKMFRTEADGLKTFHETVHPCED